MGVGVNMRFIAFFGFTHAPYIDVFTNLPLPFLEPACGNCRTKTAKVVKRFIEVHSRLVYGESLQIA